ncbi:MAG: hypothetical protein A2W85_00120 [Bacteroidetes bacterium GWF2_41_31]|nr:MAG: hypothetical protein A2W85_00120 [Bacteroidetes bacterium GWF2_41_31]
MLKTLIYATIFLFVSQAYSQGQIKQIDYGKLLFNSYPTYDMVVDLGEGKFVMPIVTLKKQALLDCYSYDLQKIYSTPFRQSINSKKDKFALITSFHENSKTLYALRQDNSNNKYFIEYLKIDPKSGKTIDQEILLKDQQFPNAYYFSDNKEYFVVIPLISLNGLYEYELFNYKGEKLYTSIIENKEAQSFSGLLNVMTVSDHGDVYVERRLDEGHYSFDAFDVSGKEIVRLPLKIESKNGEVVDLIMTKSGDREIIVTALLGDKKNFELKNWVIDFKKQELQLISSFDINEEIIGKYMASLDKAQIVSVKTPKPTNNFKDLSIVKIHYVEGQIIAVLESYEYTRGMLGTTSAWGTSNDTYIISTKLNGDLNWVFALPRKVAQSLSKYKLFGPMGETVKVKTDVIDGVLKVITTENYSNGNYGYEVLREIDLSTGEVSFPKRLQNKENAVFDFSFYDYYKWISTDEIIMMTAKGFGFKLVKINTKNK